MNSVTRFAIRFFLRLLPLLLLAGACACEDPLANRSIAKPEQKEKTEKSSGGKPRKYPEMGASQVIKARVEELSGLCMTKDSTALWAVGDEGAICKVSFSGVVTPVLKTRLDAEGITLNPATGDLYIAVEGDQMVCRLKAPDYQRLDTLFYIKEAVEEDFDNNGLEGISFYKDSLLFVGSQEDALLWTCKLDGTIVSRRSLMDETSLIEEIAGLCYDPVKNWLWVTDSDACKLFLFSAETFDLLASYDIPSIENAESICVDRTHGYVWVGSDEDSPKIYRFSFKF
ncbi:MAG: hypothetical protein IKM93_06590 [Bacteroidales bacterium]|nr:hypothetical protein [Bacteroidales bacterium]